MRTFNFLLLAMLSCIAMIGAVPIVGAGGNAGSAIEIDNSDDIAKGGQS